MKTKPDTAAMADAERRLRMAIDDAPAPDGKPGPAVALALAALDHHALAVRLGHALAVCLDRAPPRARRERAGAWAERGHAATRAGNKGGNGDE